ncbi:MAG: GumC family protein [Geitlerinemataceae cyanobacterium]
MAPSIVKRYAIAFSQYKIVGFAAFALCVAGAGLMSLSEPPAPSYKATAALASNAPSIPLSTTGPSIHEQGKAALTPEFLVDDIVAEDVANKVGIGPALVKAASIRVPKEDEPQFYYVAYKDSTPERAETVVQLLMEAMVEKSLAFNQSRLNSTIEAMEARMPDVALELEIAEERLVRFDRVEGAIFLEAETGSLQGEIIGAQGRQRQATQQIQAIGSSIASLERQLGLSVDEAYTSGALSRDPIVANIRNQISQIETQQTLDGQTLRPEHPQMQAYQRQIGGLEGLLEARAAEIIGGDGLGAPLPTSDRIRVSSALDPIRQEMAAQLINLRLERENAERALEIAQSSEQDAMQRFMSLPDLQLERERIARELAIKKGFHDQLQAQLIDARAARDETTSNLVIAQLPEIEETITPPPNVILLVVGGAAVGLIIGGASIFLLSALEGRCYTMEEVSKAFADRELGVLATIPQLIDFEHYDDEAMVTIVDPESPYLEYYERLRSNIARSSEANTKAPKVVAMTSCGAEEGKTLTTYNLAIAAARAGKRTLIIEADLRSPSQAEALGVSVDPESLREPLQHYDPIRNNMRLVPGVENLYVIPTPGPQARAVAIVESSEMRSLIEMARQRFDFVVVDTPSMSRCNDTLAIEPLTDGLILVGRPGFTQTALGTEQANAIEEAEDKLTVIGSVVNGAEIAIELPPLPEEDELAVEEVSTSDSEPLDEREELSPSERRRALF